MWNCLEYVYFLLGLGSKEGTECTHPFAEKIQWKSCVLKQSLSFLNEMELAYRVLVSLK